MENKTNPFDDMPPAEQGSTIADANRYRAIRALLCEPNESKRGIVFAAVDAFMCAQPDLDDGTLTPKRWDKVIDGLLQAARDADR
jgi:hypothetical protein